jgi:hypothetical protein
VVAAGAAPSAGTALAGGWSSVHVQFQTHVQLPRGAMAGAFAHAPSQFHTQVHSLGTEEERALGSVGLAAAAAGVDALPVDAVAAGVDALPLDAVAAGVEAASLEAVALGAEAVSSEAAATADSLGAGGADSLELAGAPESPAGEGEAEAVAVWEAVGAVVGCGAAASETAAGCSVAGRGAAAAAEEGAAAAGFDPAAAGDSAAGFEGVSCVVAGVGVAVPCVTAPSSPGLSIRTETFTLPGAVWTTAPESPGLSTRTETLTLAGAAISSARAGAHASVPTAPRRSRHRRRTRAPAIAPSMPPNAGDDPCNRR